MLMLKNILLVGIGGMIGSMLRYSLFLFIGNHSFPYATLVVNVLGSLIIGIILGINMDAMGSNTLRLFLATGICGGFTTFSALSIESMQLLQQQKYVTAATYVAVSVVLGIAAAFAGFFISKHYY